MLAAMADVEIYTRMLCGYCVSAKALLKRKGVAFKEFDASFDASRRKEMIARTGGPATFPQVFIGGRHVGGCDDLHALDRRGELDRLLNGGAPA
jgi:glutaredoxin 3